MEKIRRPQYAYDDVASLALEALVNALGLDIVTILANLPAILKKVSLGQALFLINAAFSNRDAVFQTGLNEKKLKLSKLLTDLPLTISGRDDVDDEYNFKLLRVVGAMIIEVIYQADSSNGYIASILQKHPSPFRRNSGPYTGSDPAVVELKEEMRNMLSPLLEQLTAMVAKDEPLRNQMVALSKAITMAKGKRAEEVAGRVL